MDISTHLTAKALDGLHLRYLYTAQNIANAHTPNYGPVRVSFEEALRSAAARGESGIRDVEPVVSVNGSGEAAMRLDLELATASHTAQRYRALIEMMGRQMAIHRAALSSGR